jgi:hypothetical protein
MRARRIWMMSASLVCAVAPIGALAEGCVSSSNVPDLNGSLDADLNFDATGFDASGFDATGLDVNSPPHPDGGGGGSPDGSANDGGGGGPDDGGGSTTLDAAPQIIVPTLANAAMKLVAGGGYLFWNTYSTGPDSPILGIYDMHDGGTTLFTAPTAITDLAVDDAGVVFFTGIQVDRLPFGGSTPEDLGGGEILTASPVGLQVHGPDIYFVAGSGIYRMPATGSGNTPVDVFDGFLGPRGLAFAGGNAYVATTQSNGSASTATIEYVAESNLGVDAGPDAVVTIATGQNYPDGLVTDGTHLAWTSEVTGQTTVVSSNLDGGSLAHYAQLSNEIFLACDGQNLYWGSPGNVDDAGLYPSYNVVMRAPIGNPAAAQGIYQVHDVVESVTVDDTWVYWSTLNGKQIYRAPK